MIQHRRATHILVGIAATLAGVATVSARPDPNTGFVAADVVKLRKLPSPSGQLLANLRINTTVKLTGGGAPPDWVRIRTISRPPVTGYVSAPFLSRRKQAAQALQADIIRRRASGDLAGAILVAERLMALKPDDRKIVEQLRDMYRRIGNDAAVKRLTASLNGEDPKYIVACTNTRAGKQKRSVVLGYYQRGAGITSLVGVEPGRLKNLRLSLQRSPWSVLDPINVDKSRVMAGTGLLSGYVVSGRKSLRPGLMDTSKLVFSEGCWNPELILSTEPTTAVKTAIVDWTSVGRLVDRLRRKNGLGDHVYWVRAQRILGGTPLINIEMGPIDYRSRGRYATPHKKDSAAFAWGLFDESSGRLLASSGHYNRPDSNVTVSTVTWFKWRESPERVAVIQFSENHDSGGAGARAGLVVVNPSGAVSQKIVALNTTFEP